MINIEILLPQRGGTHLGSITITGAQIGRQQRTDRHSGNDDEKEYRHAFLIVEAKKGPGGSHPRHVLCAESDEERDAWVDMLVRYFTGVYSEEPLNYGPASSSSSAQQQQHGSTGKHPPSRGVSKEEISISKTAAVPLSQLQQDSNNAKLFSTPYNVDEYNNPNNSNTNRSASPVKSMGEPSPVERASSSQSQNFPQSQGQGNQNNLNARRVLDRLQGLPSSLPDSSPLSSTATAVDVIGQRPNSALGHCAGAGNGGMMETPDRRKASKSPERHRNESRKSLHPPPNNSNSNNNSATNNANANSDLRSASPEKMDAASSSTKVKISGPLNGTPIPSGFKFGKDREKEKEENTSGGSDRREKARSRFWPGWRANGQYGLSHPSLDFTYDPLFSLCRGEAARRYPKSRIWRTVGRES